MFYVFCKGTKLIINTKQKFIIPIYANMSCFSTLSTVSLTKENLNKNTKLCKMQKDGIFTVSYFVKKIGLSSECAKNAYIYGKIRYFSTVSTGFVTKESLNKEKKLCKMLKNERFTVSVTNESLKKGKKSSKLLKDGTFTISYLVKKCGLSLECAKKASEKVCFENSTKPDSVIELLKNHGFDDTDLPVIIRKQPRILVADTENTLLPKLNFFRSIGFSESDICRLLLLNPRILERSLEKQLIPIYKFLKSVISSDQKIGSVLKRVWSSLHPRNVVSNLDALRELSVPLSSIELLTSNFPVVMLQRHEKFLEALDRVKDMGFDPSKSSFVLAVRVLSGKGNKVIWERCSETYKKWGLSEDDILSAFKKYPLCMVLSVKKIDRAMDLFVNKMGIESKVVLERPGVLVFNVERRIIPRCLVVQVLISKGVMTEVNLGSLLTPVEKLFLKRYVSKYEKELPELMSVYRGQVKGLVL